jgi:filamentous hemagglutinin family protein
MIMHQTFSSVVQILICTLSFLSATATLAQVNPDNTLDTQVETNGNVSEITGGQMRGSNLFHSFQDFSVKTGTEAFFNNANNISNIFSRVTGNSISEIDGLIRANGSADLFLINPNGIIFGENAQLNIGGSFLGSTASSILFEDGEFSTTDVDSPPLLTINAPIGLNLGTNPGEIVNRSTVQDSEVNSVGLEVLAGNNLSLVGGQIEFEGGNVTASGGNVTLGGLSTAGEVGISEDGSLSFPKDVAQADLSLGNGSVVDVAGTGGGKITVNARNLNLTASSFLSAGISVNSTSNDAQAGDIVINATDNLTVDQSLITNQVNQEGVGNSGNININTGSLETTNGGIINASTSGQGNAGLVEITASDTISIDGESANGSSSFIGSRVEPGAVGNAEGVNISTTNLTVSNGGYIDGSTFSQGNAGLIDITSNNITFEGKTSNGFPSSAFSQVNPGGVGNAEGVNISTDNLTLKDGGLISANTFGQGNGGNINIDAFEELSVDSSFIVSEVGSNAIGNGGNVNLFTKSLSLTNGGSFIFDGSFISASTFGQGNGGNINIDATTVSVFEGASLNSNIGGSGRGEAGNITINANDVIFNGGFARSRLEPGGEGSGGDIKITTGSLLVTGIPPELTGNVGQLVTATFGKGDAGSLTIDATEDVTFDGRGSDVFSLVGGNLEIPESPAEGNAGDIIINSESLSVKNQARLISSVEGIGTAGNISINTNSLSITNEGSLLTDVANTGTGNAGNIKIVAESVKITNRGLLSARTALTGNGGNIILEIANLLLLRNNSNISTTAGVEGAGGNGGNIKINADFVVAFPLENSDITANAFEGNGGNIDIDAQRIFGIEQRQATEGNITNDIDASSEFGLSGTVEINILQVDPSQDSLNIPVEPVQGEVTQTCEINSTGNQSEFVVTGRGGLPPEPEDNFRLPAIATVENTLESQPSAQQPPEVSPPIVEATGWVRNAQGKIVLVASPAQASSLNSHSNPPKCKS